MRRVTGLLERPNWHDIVTGEGLVYVDTEVGGQTLFYWREGVAYELTGLEIKFIEDVSRRLVEMLIEAGDYVIENGLFHKLGIRPLEAKAIKELWKDPKNDENLDKPEEWARPGWYTAMLYGRFDLCPELDAFGNIVGLKLLEYNADTPTGLVESAVCQYNYALAAGLIGEGTGQCNELYESLVLGWMYEIRNIRRINGRNVSVVHFAYSCQESSGEDACNVGLMMDAAREASENLEEAGEPGFRVRSLYMDQIVRAGTVDSDGNYVGVQYFSAPIDQNDPDGPKEPIEVIFKLYPWEWLVQDKFGQIAIENMLELDGTIWIEPIWKLLWSNKGVLAILWEVFKDTDDAKWLLPAYFAGEEPAGFNSYARKPLHGREGNGTTLVRNGQVLEQGPTTPYSGDTGTDGPYILQDLCTLPEFLDDNGPALHPLLSVWTVQKDPVGLAIRESPNCITNNESSFVTHYIVDLLPEQQES